MENSKNQPTPDYAQAIAHALHRLRTELAAQLTYHNLWHTEQDVMLAVVRLGRQSGLTAEEIQLLEVAAAYHDTGFIYTRSGHELVSKEIMAQSLPQYGFSPAQIEQIGQIILATRVPQNPHNLVEQIIADADLDVLGREDFFERSKALWLEQGVYGGVVPWETWLKMQLKFLGEHHYFTPAAIASRQEMKLKHIAILEEMIRHG